MCRLWIPALLIAAFASGCGTDEIADMPDAATADASVADAGCSSPCGASCCTSEQVCEAGACRARCTPACDGRYCGPDGCGGICGSCSVGFVCEDSQGVCKPCTPSCQGKTCGSDGCGGVCGTCGTGSTCDGSNCIACTPKSCGELGKNCGRVANGCGGFVECGNCPGGQTCGGGGATNVCGCTPKSCTEQGKNCGVINDGCGGSIDCGACSGTQTCGGGGVANVCGTGVCIPKSCAEQGKNCGVINDGCGSTMACGGCTLPNTCGGGGVQNVCGCSQESDAVLCGRAGATCGTITATDGCGQSRTIVCGTCTLPETCGGAGTNNVCGCTAETDGQLCAAQGRMCGPATATDRCGRARSVTCGTCPTGESCTAAGTCQPPCGPATCAGGCCVGGVCQPGNTVSACGKGGGACFACTGLHVCRADQTCGIDPNSMWRVQPTSATADTKNASGADWDFSWSDQTFIPPDLYVAMGCPPATTPSTSSTPVVSNAYTASWSTGGCTANASELLSKPFVFELLDDDPFDNPDSVSGVAQFQFEEQDLIRGSVTLGRLNQMSSITLKITRQ